MNLNLAGRVRNLRLNSSDCLLPLFEAVVNSIHALEETAVTAPRIEIVCHRERNLYSEDHSQADSIPWTKFEVVDNGIGFSEANFASFCTSDSTYKLERGGKGVGRLLWLKAFSQCEVESTYLAEGVLRRRKFEFSLSHNGVGAEIDHIAQNGEPGTKVTLIGFSDPYKKAAPHSISSIAQAAFDHCLEYLVLGRAPEVIFSGLDGDSVSLASIYRSLVKGTSADDRFLIREEELSIKHLLLRAGSGRQHRLFLCANSRPVQSIVLSPRVANLPASFSNDGDRLVYAGYISGSILDSSVNQERTGFCFRKEVSPLSPGEVTEQELSDSVISQAAKHLQSFTEPIRVEKEARIRAYVVEKAPEYKPLLKHKAALLEKIPPDLSDTKLDLELYKLDRQYECELREKQVTILADIDSQDKPENFDEHYRAFLEEWNESGMSKLARYVAYRKATIMFLDANVRLSGEGKYSKEEAIHKIIFPLRKTSDDVRADQMNLWIIDERLAFHHYLASDVPFTALREDVLRVPSSDRPDIAIFNRPTAFAQEESSFSSVVLVEFKRPSRNDFSDTSNPISQIYEYVRTIQSGQAKDRHGRTINVPRGIPFYAYVLADLEPSLVTQCENASLIKSADGMGYFGFNQNRNTYIEVLSFDKVISDSRKRNSKFFDELGILK